MEAEMSDDEGHSDDGDDDDANADGMLVGTRQPAGTHLMGFSCAGAGVTYKHFSPSRRRLVLDCRSTLASMANDVSLLQDELIGEAREGKRDAARAEKHHAEWAQAQDARDMEAVVGAMRAGWRRPGRNGGLDGDLVRCILLLSCDWQPMQFC
jgi:hypothetical protein